MWWRVARVVLEAKAQRVVLAAAARGDSVQELDSASPLAPTMPLPLALAAQPEPQLLLETAATATIPYSVQLLARAVAVVAETQLLEQAALVAAVEQKQLRQAPAIALALRPRKGTMAALDWPRQLLMVAAAVAQERLVILQLHRQMQAVAVAQAQPHLFLAVALLMLAAAVAVLILELLAQAVQAVVAMEVPEARLLAQEPPIQAAAVVA